MGYVSIACIPPLGLFRGRLDSASSRLLDLMSVSVRHKIMQIISIIIKSLDPLRAKKAFIRKKFGTELFTQFNMCCLFIMSICFLCYFPFRFRALAFSSDSYLSLLAFQYIISDTLQNENHNLSLVMRKPVFGVSDQVLHKPGCTATEDG